MSSPDAPPPPSSGPWCNICGGTEFGNGPFGRLSVTGKPPRCLRCDALERHRIMRAVYTNLPLGLFHGARMMQFSKDPAVDPRWFRSFERSIYGVENSLDLQKIDRPDGAYDLISLNHVLEFVPDARGAFHELVRICAPDGLIQVGFSQADKRPQCLDYAEQQGLNGYYHLFGLDMPAYLGLPDLGIDVRVLSGRDPVTGVVESFHFFSRRADILDFLETSSCAFEWSKPLQKADHAEASRKG